MAAMPASRASREGYIGVSTPVRAQVSRLTQRVGVAGQVRDDVRPRPVGQRRTARPGRRRSARRAGRRRRARRPPTSAAPSRSGSAMAGSRLGNLGDRAAVDLLGADLPAGCDAGLSPAQPRREVTWPHHPRCSALTCRDGNPTLEVAMTAPAARDPAAAPAEPVADRDPTCRWTAPRRCPSRRRAVSPAGCSARSPAPPARPGGRPGGPGRRLDRARHRRASRPRTGTSASPTRPGASQPGLPADGADLRRRWAASLTRLVDDYEADGADWRDVERARFALERAGQRAGADQHAARQPGGAEEGVRHRRPQRRPRRPQHGRRPACTTAACRPRPTARRSPWARTSGSPRVGRVPGRRHRADPVRAVDADGAGAPAGDRPAADRPVLLPGPAAGAQLRRVRRRPGSARSS